MPVSDRGESQCRMVYCIGVVVITFMVAKGFNVGVNIGIRQACRVAHTSTY